MKLPHLTRKKGQVILPLEMGRRNSFSAGGEFSKRERSKIMGLVKITGARVLMRRIVTLVVLVILAIGAWWCWQNRDWLIYKAQRQYDRQAYGLNWKTDISTAGDKARREKKQIMIAFLKEGHADSDRLKRSIFPDPGFKVVENNYVLLLVDYPQDTSKMSAREKAFCDELIKRYAVDRFAVFLVAEPKEGGQQELRRFTYAGERPRTLLDKLAGGRFIAKEAVDSTPQMKSLDVPDVSKLKELVPVEGTITVGEDPAAAPEKKQGTITVGEEPAAQ